MKKEPVFETKSHGWLKPAMRWAVDLVVVITLAVFAVLMFGNLQAVSGKSMEPTLQNEDSVLIDRLRYNFLEPKRMEFIAFEGTDGKIFIKRIIGLPGETVRISGGVIYVNDEELEVQDSLKNISLPGLAEEGVTLTSNEYFVLGDDPKTSEDSRFAEIGNVRKDKIIGKVWLRCLPYKRLGLVR